jgi:hypothetical protein
VTVTVPTSGGGPIAALQLQINALAAIPSTSPTYGHQQHKLAALQDTLIDTLMQTGHLTAASILTLSYGLRLPLHTVAVQLQTKVTSIQTALTAAQTAGSNAANGLQNELNAAQIQLVDALLDEGVLTAAGILASSLTYIGAPG